MRFDDLPTPCYVIDEGLIEANLKVLRSVMDSTGCRILLAQKAFSAYALYPLIGKYLSGTAASGLFEARLGREEMGGEVHVYSPAYRQDEFDEILRYADHVVMNSVAQLDQFGDTARSAGASIGLRINPECSTQQHAAYDPCAPGSRLGATRNSLNGQSLHNVEGLHFHCLCEQGADALEITLRAVEDKFGKYLQDMRWLNLGGGHHITKPGYDIALLEKCVTDLQRKTGAQIYLEPGEAIALNAGFLVTTVLDTLANDGDIAIVDTSAACHMPDVLEMPYRPPLADSGLPGEKSHTYTLGGPTCLAGDVIGAYSFDQPLRAGDRLVFGDMAIYSMVKNNTFNGVNLPSIAIQHRDGDCEVIRTFGYDHFKARL